jgi:hypothetical protein
MARCAARAGVCFRSAVAEMRHMTRAALWGREQERAFSKIEKQAPGPFLKPGPACSAVAIGGLRTATP